VPFALSSGGIQVPVTVTVCAGSSCHVRGSRAVLKRFAEIIKAEQLEDEVSLVGSFCMERCGESMNWKFNEQEVSSQSVEEAEATLRQKLAEESKQL
jgi:NADH:ubiquinone oxidoreductase subunit E